LAVGLFALVLAVSACGSKEITLKGENGETTKIRTDGNKTTVKTDSGTVSVNASGDDKSGKIEWKDDKGNTATTEYTEEGKIPAGFPSDLKVLANSKVTGAVKSEDNGNRSYIVSMEIKSDLKKAKADYEGMFKQAGYKVTSIIESEDMFMTGGEKGESKVSLTMTQEDDKLTGALTFLEPMK